MNLPEQAVAAGLEHGPPAAIEILATTTELAETIEAYRTAIGAAYWEHHDVALMSAITFAALGRLLDVSKQHAGTDDDVTASKAGASLLYNLASFTWPGWDEPGIELTAEDQQRGMSAAEAHVALLDELDTDEITRSRGRWILGAHLLSAGRFGGAAARFDEAAALADRADDDVEAKLSSAFAALAHHLKSGGNDESGLVEALDMLRACEDGEAFVAQVETAREVLARD